MKQLFKTTLLAAAVAVTCGSAIAGDVSVVTQVHSVEGLEGVTADQTSNDIFYTVNAAYRDGDKITFTFTEGSLVTNGFPSQLNVAAVDSDDPTKAIAGMALGLLNSDANSVTYRVTSISQPKKVTVVAPATTPEAYTDRTTLGAKLKLGQVKFKASVLKASGVSVSVDSQTTAGDILDNNGTRTGVIAKTASQFGSASVTHKFDATVDVASMRKAFVSGPGESMSWLVTNPTTTGWLNMATVNPSKGTMVTLLGEAGKMTDLKPENWTSGSGTRTFTEAEAKLVVDYSGMVTNDTVTFTPGLGDKAVVLETQSFSAKVEYNYTSAAAQAGSKLVGAGMDAGAWKLNGATVNIPYMPYGPSASQIIYVSNAGKQDGDITVTAFDDKGEFYDLGVIGIAGGQRVTKLAKLIEDKFKDAGFKGTKASITITVNAPEADITVYASYNIGSADRGFINTDQYKGKK
jgi:hypothetical protein